jgi:hypothetical protein
MWDSNDKAFILPALKIPASAVRFYSWPPSLKPLWKKISAQTGIIHAAAISRR